MAVEIQAEMPFFESAEDATYTAILASRKTIKEVAVGLWPHLCMDSAYARLKGALSAERPEKLAADEHLFIANFCGQWHFLHYVENQCHHSGTRKVEPADELATLQEAILKGQRELTQSLNRFNSLRAGAK